jgi:hypothetical protein
MRFIISAQLISICRTVIYEGKWLKHRNRQQMAVWELKKQTPAEQ